MESKLSDYTIESELIMDSNDFYVDKVIHNIILHNVVASFEVLVVSIIVLMFYNRISYL